MLHVGDTVQVVNPRLCTHGYVIAMSQYNYCFATITDIATHDQYSIDVDKGQFVWCSQTLKPAIGENLPPIKILSDAVATDLEQQIATWLEKGYTLSTTAISGPANTYTVAVVKNIEEEL